MSISLPPALPAKKTSLIEMGLDLNSYPKLTIQGLFSALGNGEATLGPVLDH